MSTVINDMVSEYPSETLAKFEADLIQRFQDENPSTSAINNADLAARLIEAHPEMKIVIAGDDHHHGMGIAGKSSKSIMEQIKEQHPSVRIAPEQPLKLADIPGLMKGSIRLDGEDFATFKERQKKENKLMKVRLRLGVSRLSGNTKPYRSEERALKKAVKKHKAANGGKWKHQRRESSK